MDDVPVKISEKYKPPPRVYQLPLAITNKLQLPPDHYHCAPQFTYDFLLERKVLAKAPEWKRMRQQDREVRRQRKERREQQRLRAVEAQHKQLLGAVSYPNAEELSSTSDEEESGAYKEQQRVTTTSHSDSNAREATGNDVICTQTSSFHNILQPTILSRSSGGHGDVESVKGDPVAPYFNFALAAYSPAHAGHALAKAGGGAVEKISSTAFNYKDFEDDTSSPFDNIELKTINDLDVLAQVLHNTQLEIHADERQAQKESVINGAANAGTQPNNAAAAKDEQEEQKEAAVSADLTALADTKAALMKVDFQDLSQQLQNEDIPNNYAYAMPQPPNNYNKPFVQQHGAYTAFNPQHHLYSDGIAHQQSSSYEIHALHPSAVAYNNQNYSYTTPSLPSSQTFLGVNANNYSGTYAQIAQLNPANTGLSEAEIKLRSKSVPDILKELSEEVSNSEIRRSRNYSHNIDGQGEEKGAAETVNEIAVQRALPQYYAHLEVAAQKLAKNISSMGFPLERVAKLAKIFGADDKKIFEHLIPLSELMDLGFDETKISDALIQCNNNKEKALEYLIS